MAVIKIEMLVDHKFRVAGAEPQLSARFTITAGSITNQNDLDRRAWRRSSKRACAKPDTSSQPVFHAYILTQSVLSCMVASVSSHAVEQVQAAFARSYVRFEGPYTTAQHCKFDLFLTLKFPQPYCQFLTEFSNEGLVYRIYGSLASLQRDNPK
jgi:hypothetical protein